MVVALGRAMIVRTSDSAGRLRCSTRKRKWKLRRTFSGYTQASKFPASFPNTPARGPVAHKNSQGRAPRLSSSSCAWIEVAADMVRILQHTNSTGFDCRDGEIILVLVSRLQLAKGESRSI